MGQAPEFVPSPAEDNSTFSERSIISGVIEAAVAEPDNSAGKESRELSLHAEVFHILSDKAASRSRKAKLLAELTFEKYGNFLEDLDKSTLPDEKQLEELTNLALHLSTSALGDSDTQLDLEMLDDLVSKVSPVSPIPLAKTIEHLESYHPLTQVNTLAIKLWTLGRYGMQDDMTTHFDRTRAYCRDHPFNPPPRTSPGRSPLS